MQATYNPGPGDVVVETHADENELKHVDCAEQLHLERASVAHEPYERAERHERQQVERPEAERPRQLVARLQLLAHHNLE